MTGVIQQPKDTRGFAVRQGRRRESLARLESGQKCLDNVVFSGSFFGRSCRPFTFC